MTAPRLLAGLALVAAAACDFHVVTAGSNFPDSGVVCATDAGLGAGTLAGAGAFQVGAAYEGFREVVDNDSGVVSARSVDVKLTRQAVACGAVPEPGPALVLTLFDPGGRYGPGEYVAGSQQLAAFCACVTGPDGGRGALVGLAGSSDGGASALIASGGVVRVTSFGACSLSGSFDVRFTTPDGGDAGGLSGTFDPVYCPH